MKNKILNLKLIIIIVFILLILTSCSTTPLKEEDRNISTSNITLEIDIDDKRTPIIRTYMLEEFNSFNEKQIEKIKDTVRGNIEGDIPALIIEDGIAMLNISFKDTDKDIQIITDNIPNIKIFALDTIYSQEKPKIIEDEIIKIDNGNEDGKYIYEIQRYFLEDEIYHDEDDDMYMEGIYIHIYYNYKDVEYISILGLNTIEYIE